ncbi:MAG TPA: hypothetical protein VGG58_11130 [Candidatus Acidoferrum sp.]|jgi:hypothetical protein
MASKTGEARAPEPSDDGTRIVLQVGTDLRITNKGEIILGNPELEFGSRRSCRRRRPALQVQSEFGRTQFSLVDPLADRKHTKVHKPGD